MQHYYRKEPKHPDLITDDLREAERLGLSFGVYVAYKKSGYLPEYIRQKEAREKSEEGANIIESHLGGAGGGKKHNYFYGDKKS